MRGAFHFVSFVTFVGMMPRDLRLPIEKRGTRFLMRGAFHFVSFVTLLGLVPMSVASLKLVGRKSHNGG